jgi:amino acid adenylation domain-containing protein
MSEVDYPRNSSIHALFSRVAEAHADKIAVVLPAVDKGELRSLTYAELTTMSDRLARHLVAEGVMSGEPVGLYVERSLEMVVAMLAVLKVGGAFVPLDLAYPSDRLSFMLKDTGARVVLTFSHLQGDLDLADDIKVVCLDEEIAEHAAERVRPQVEATDLACILYTSGSTGRPKGVEVPHRSIVRLVMNTHYARFDESRVFLQLVPISFDVAEFEIWGALLHGATCVLYPGYGVPDPRVLQSLIGDYGITTLWLTTSLFNTVVDDEPELLDGVEELLIGGEALSVAHIVKAQQRLPSVQFINGYGPTESNITTYYRIPRPFDPSLSSVPIGKAIANSSVYILDQALCQVDPGVEGEVYIGGDGVARGYLNLPEKTAACFISDPFSGDPEAKLYKTGDRARYLDDGDIDFIGRMDDQVKIDGHRIELGEIEAVIRSNAGVRDAGVTVFQSEAGLKQLVAYVAFAESNSDFSILKSDLAAQLPDYMVPYHWMALDKIPLTENGKLDRRALPSPVRRRPDLTQPYIPPRNDRERSLAALWQSLLLIDKVGIRDNFFELGGSSLLSLQFVNRLRQESGIALPIVDFFERPVIEELLAMLDGDQAQASVQTERTSGEKVSGGIAIVGMAGRFPGARDVDALWKNLCEGVESITFFDDDQLDPSIPDATKNDRNYVKARGVLDGADLFDARFFGINPLEASIMDPQQRLFLEVCWETLENAGYDPARYPGSVGIYAGMNSNTYYANNVVHHPDRISALGEFQTMLANESDYLTTRASFKLGLTGPSVNVYTACSTSLTATCYAVEGLRNGQCDMALAGGVSVILPQQSGYIYQEGGMFPRDGHCRPFDADSSGTTFNSGIGLVLLKREEDARRDGDRIYAVIRGVGLNNDGGGKASFTAPSVEGQASAIAMAQRDADFDPATISYVETHGTGTPLGDPIEIAGLSKAFGDKVSVGSCAIGSIKGNIGHLIHAAGVTGLIKTALSLYNGMLPPSVNYSQPNPKIDFSRSPFYVNDGLKAWPSGETPRRAGVSSFGVGGTNAHVVLEASEQPEVSQDRSRPRQLLLLSARSEEALDASAARLRQHLTEENQRLQSVAYTLQMGRQSFEFRRVVVCAETEDALSSLGGETPTKVISARSAGYSRPVVFMFPGQGSQYLNMGRNLYQSEPLFRQAIDRCDSLLGDQLSPRLLEVLYPDTATDEGVSLINQTKYTQPALFAIEYALAQLLMSWGLTPSAMVGHSIGEFVAACLAGVFSLEDGLAMVAKRADLMQSCPPGSMLSVRLPAAEVSALIDDTLELAAVNTPNLCVVSGRDEAIASFKQELDSQGVGCRVLHTSHAFHSAMMDPAVAPFRDFCAQLAFSPPQMPFVSTATGDWITQEQAIDPGYWASHLRETVQFGAAIETLWQEPGRILLEVGPRTAASTLARQVMTDRKSQLTLSSLGDSWEQDAEWESLLLALGRLWVHGVEIDWPAFWRDEKVGRVPLPTYPFERKRFWLDAPANVAAESFSRASEQVTTTDEVTMSSSNPISTPSQDNGRVDRLSTEIRRVMEDTSGIEMSDKDNDIGFLELGFDSLVLTQASLALKNKFKVDITFRELMEEYTTTQALATHLHNQLPPEEPQRPAVTEQPASGQAPVAQLQPVQPVSSHISAAQMSDAGASSLEQVIRGQIELMARQLEMLGLPGAVSTPAVAAATPQVSAPVSAETEKEPQPAKIAAHGPAVRIQRKSAEALSDEQQGHLETFIQRYNARLAKSKQGAQEHRACLADPRTVSGFKPVWKEMIYPIVVERSSGSKLWDIDGNEYVDLTCGFGSNMFGWSAPFIVEAVEKQLKSGYEIGPQHPLAGQVAEKVCAMTGNERVAFCNTGSEAVLAAIRLSRTVTGRDKIVMFEGGYHGIIDEVIARGGPKGRAFPAAPGIPRAMVENMMVLEYGTSETLAIIESMKDELAAVLVEPVQSRRPDLQPKAFIQSLRAITESSGAALILDEVVTGFRVHPAGIQGYYGIHADLVTYGKVVGGGMPFGLIGGDAKFMDALDGGQWRFGDNSIPEAGVTFFAGTFVRHPLALAAANAVLDRLAEEGSALQDRLAEKTESMANRINTFLKQEATPFELPCFRSIFYLRYAKEMTHGGLLFALLREKGMHIWEGRPCFLTTAHTDEDVEKIVSAFKESIAELQTMGFLQAPAREIRVERRESEPPVPGARLGKKPDGTPAWFVADEERPGKYKIVEAV